MKSAKYVTHFRIDKPGKFRLADYDPGDTRGLDIDKSEAKEMLARDIERLGDLQERLATDPRWAVLVVFQAMDAAGKDSVIKHVMSGVNPQGVEVHAFKQPSHLELAHDFLWRAALRLPERGRIGIFNRSHYEEVLVVRVRPELLGPQNLPPQLTDSKNIWKKRFRSIREFEHHLVQNGTIVLKFFLHVSKKEQKKQFLERIDDPAKRWKFNTGDIADRKLWDRYMAAYEDMIRNTSTEEAPWYVVPADNKWFTRLVVAGAVVEALDRLNPTYPKVEGAALRELKRARAALVAERG